MSGGHSADWNTGYKAARPIYNSANSWAGLPVSEIVQRCTNLISAYQTENVFHGNMNEAVAGCEAAMNVGT